MSFYCFVVVVCFWIFIISKIFLPTRISRGTRVVAPHRVWGRNSHVTLSWVGKEVLPCIGLMYLPTLIEFSIHLVVVYESHDCGLEYVNIYGNWSQVIRIVVSGSKLLLVKYGILRV